MLRLAMAFVIVAILAVPPATASAGAGEFVVEGAVGLAGFGELRGGFAGALAMDGAVSRLEVGAARVTWRVFEMEWLEVAGQHVQLRPQQETRRTLSEVTLVSEGVSAPTIVGLYPAQDAEAGIVFSDGLDLRARARSILASDDVSAREGPDTSGYSREIDVPHFVARGRGVLVSEGAGALTIMGPTIRVDSRDGAWSERTGEWRESDGRVITRWAYAEFAAARVVVESGAVPITALFTDSRAAWNGAFDFDRASGRFETVADAFAVTDDSGRFEGVFEARLVPMADGDRAASAVTLEGSVTTMSLRSRPGPVTLAAPTADAPALMPFLLVTVGVAGIGAAAWVARGRWMMTPRPDELAALARGAIAQERWSSALAWSERALARAPDRVDIMLDTAFLMARVGRFEDAMALHERASQTHPDDGAPAFHAALTAVAANAPATEIETWLAVALRRSPALADDVEAEPEFSFLRTRPTFIGLLQDAYDVQDRDARRET